MPSDVNAEAYEPHDCFGVGWAVEVRNGVNPAVGQEYSFRNKFETKVHNCLAVECTFVDT